MNVITIKGGATALFLLRTILLCSGSATADERRIGVDRRRTSAGQCDSRQSAMTFVDIGDDEIGFINPTTDALIQVGVNAIPGWPYPNETGILQHTWQSLDGHRLYVTTVATESTVDAAIVVLAYSRIGWNAGEVRDLRVLDVHVVEPPGTPSSFPAVCTESDTNDCADGTIFSVSPQQPISSWPFLAYAQIHGPTNRPGTSLSYCGTVADDQMVVVEESEDEEGAVTVSSSRYPGFSDHSHGYFFNEAGTKALNAGYFYDATSLRLFHFQKCPADPVHVSSIPLGENDNVYGAFTHYVAWINNRYAITATMQFAATSMTAASGVTIEPPGIYLIDTKNGTATRVIGTAANATEAGVYRSASDILYSEKYRKVYVLEEDTLESTFGRDGHVSIFRVRKNKRLEFVKRISPGGSEGMPSDFTVAHGGILTKKHLYVSSYASNYILKIDIRTDIVVNYWGSDDGLNTPHGGFMTG